MPAPARGGSDPGRGEWVETGVMLDLTGEQAKVVDGAESGRESTLAERPKSRRKKGGGGMFACCACPS